MTVVTHSRRYADGRVALELRLLSSRGRRARGQPVFADPSAVREIVRVLASADEAPAR